MSHPHLEAHFGRAIRHARRALAAGNLPVGAVIVDGEGRVAGSGANRTQSYGSPVEHAEIVALQRARRRLAAAKPGEMTLVTTGEPCLMCLGAVLQTPAIGTLVWAVGPVSPAGSAVAAIRSAGYNAEGLSRLRIIAQPSQAALAESSRLLYRWCLEREDPRAAWFADAAGATSAHTDGGGLAAQPGGAAP